MLLFQRKWCRNSVDFGAIVIFCQDFSYIGNGRVLNTRLPQGFKSPCLHFQSTLAYFCIEMTGIISKCLRFFSGVWFVCLFASQLFNKDFMALFRVGSVYQRISMLRDYALLCFIEACKWNRYFLCDHKCALTYDCMLHMQCVLFHDWQYHHSSEHCTRSIIEFYDFPFFNL